jgi:hypothetical protein
MVSSSRSSGPESLAPPENNEGLALLRDLSSSWGSNPDLSSAILEAPKDLDGLAHRLVPHVVQVRAEADGFRGTVGAINKGPRDGLRVTI